MALATSKDAWYCVPKAGVVTAVSSVMSVTISPTTPAAVVSAVGTVSVLVAKFTAVTSTLPIVPTEMWPVVAVPMSAAADSTTIEVSALAKAVATLERPAATRRTTSPALMLRSSSFVLPTSSVHWRPSRAVAPENEWQTAFLVRPR